MPEEEKEKKRQEQIKYEKTLFVLSSGVFIEALKGNKKKTSALIRNGGPAVKRNVLITIERLKNWLEGH